MTGDGHGGLDSSGAGHAQQRLPLALLALVILLTALFRSPILSDDRTWYDENLVLLQGHAISYQAWPALFSQEGVLGQLTLADVLAAAKNGAYPPVMPATVFTLSGTLDPIHSLRGLFFGVGLTMLLATYLTARVAGGRWFALLATAYVASSTILTHTFQQIKWNAIAVPLVLLASALLLHRDRQSGRGIRAAYVLTLTLLLHVHYFCVWIIPGHLLFTLLADRQRIAARCKEAAAAIGAFAPWLIWALPTQLAFVRRFFDNLPVPAPDAWNAPSNLFSVTRALGYDVLVALGFLPLPLPGRWLSPVLLIAGLCLVLALRSALPGRRRLTLLALTCAGSAAAGQTLYALRLGHVVPLQPTYLSPWFALLMLGVLAGVMELQPAALRAMVVGVFLGSSVAALVTNPTLSSIADSTLPADYRALCRALNVERADVIVYDTDLLAKLVNIACSVEGAQAIGADGIRGLPSTVLSLRTLTGCHSGIAIPQGWIATEVEPCIANVRLVRFERDRSVAAVQRPRGSGVLHTKSRWPGGHESLQPTECYLCWKRQSQFREPPLSVRR